MYGNFGPGWTHLRKALVPTPSSQATTLILSGLSDEIPEDHEIESDCDDVYFRPLFVEDG